MADWSYFDCDVMIGTSGIPIPDEMADATALLGRMDHYGLDKALVYYREGRNERGVAEAAKSDRIELCWVLSLTLRGPKDRLEDQVDRMIESGAKAARFLASDGPSDAPLIIKPFLLGKVYERLQKHRAPLLIEGSPLYSPEGMARYSLEDIDAICGEFPDLPIILLRTHRSLETQLILMMRKHRNLYFTHTLATLYGQLEQNVEMMGIDRVLFGSQMPYWDPSLPIGMLNYSDLPPEQKRRIAGANLQGLLDRVS
jgi:predicted TIM-barrel fold metal-dependent hydrolase